MTLPLLIGLAGLPATSHAQEVVDPRYQAAVEELLMLPEGRAFLEAFLSIRRDYLHGSEDGQLLQGAIRGMTESLNDPYVHYLTPDEFAAEERIFRGPAAVAAILFEEIGYLRLPSFSSERVGEEARAVIDVLVRRNAAALILDLRQNGGGLVRGGLQLLDIFISDAVLGYRTTRSGAAPLAFANPGAIELPLVVLIDEGTASTAEIVAGALQTFGRASIYGMRSAGKGVGQTQVRLPDGGSIRLVTFRWLLPDRRSIEGIGIRPSVELDGATEMGSRRVVFGDPELDPLLQRALRDLRLTLVAAPSNEPPKDEGTTPRD
jgi:C-terminal processing protease CtpA/Prc